MKLIEIGTRNAFKVGSSLGFFVPRTWLADNQLDFGDLAWAQCSAVSQEVRYYLSDGPGRVPVTVQRRHPKKPVMVIPSEAVKLLGIVAQTPLVLYTIPAGPLIVKVREHAG